MLNKGLRDQESIRIDNVLKTLLSIVFVPKFWDLEDKIKDDEKVIKDEEKKKAKLQESIISLYEYIYYLQKAQRA